MGRASIKVKGGKMVKAQIELDEDNRISKIKITGDFFLHPEDLIEDMERTLLGLRLDEEELSRAIEDLMREREATLIGVKPGDIAKCVLMAGG